MGITRSVNGKTCSVALPAKEKEGKTNMPVNTTKVPWNPDHKVMQNFLLICHIWGFIVRLISLQTVPIKFTQAEFEITCIHKGNISSAHPISMRQGDLVKLIPEFNILLQARRMSVKVQLRTFRKFSHLGPILPKTC